MPRISFDKERYLNFRDSDLTIYADSDSVLNAESITFDDSDGRGPRMDNTIETMDFNHYE